MCTALTFLSKENTAYLGRTMDFSYPLSPSLFAMSPQYFYRNPLSGELLPASYGFLAIGQSLDGETAFFDGVNECGLAGAALYFSGYAYFPPPFSSQKKRSIPAQDVLELVLGHCGSLSDVRRLLPKLSIVALANPLTKSVAPLHWIFADRSGKSLVAEQTKRGLCLFDNPAGVLANSPDFPWHMTNLNNYMETSVHQEEEVSWQSLSLRPFGQAGGTSLLPGGYTSPARFVRTVFQKLHAGETSGETESVNTCFHLLEGVSIPKNIVMTNRGSSDFTQYTAFMNLDEGAYYIRTYGNSQTLKVGMEMVKGCFGETVELGRIDGEMECRGL